MVKNKFYLNENPVSNELIEKKSVCFYRFFCIFEGVNKLDMDKPKEILELENCYEITLSSIDNKSTIMDDENSNTFQLNEHYEIIGLNLIKNNISDIVILEHFKKLRFLRLSNNAISDISVLSNLTELENLDLGHNQIIDISELKNLDLLSILDLSHNQIIDIAPLSGLVKLISFRLWNNKVSDISFLKNLIELRNLVLWDNEISDIFNLKGLTNLILLDLDNNQIIDISALENLKNLNTLYLNNNQISNINSLGNLTDLTGLYLNFNSVSDISILKNLPKLTNLGLSSNDITDYTVFSLMSSKLKYLHLYLNKISDISFLKDLPSLINLDLSNNKISDISIFENLPNIKDLNLQFNQISDIRPLIRLIKEGILLFLDVTSQAGIKIKNNPLKKPPLEILQQGNDAVIRFFDKIDKEGIDKIYEAKVTLVGEGSSGKTSLINRLLDAKSILPKEEKRTRGIAIKDWEFKKQVLKKHIAHIWDFGGQDVYYPVHRFFLTENSVFVLLASSRQNAHNFDYWIPTIFQFGGQSPIILGQTCHDGNIVHWNDIGVYLANENFNIIKEQTQTYHEINLPKKNKGLINIKKSIVNQIVNLPHYKKSVPKSWIRVRELLNTLKKSNCISYGVLKEKIQETNIESFATKEDVEDCIKFFHSIGILLWYHKEEKLKDWVILNPIWAVDAVYKIIDYKKNTNKGIILSKDFDTVLNSKMYEDKHDILKEMLEVFKIAFPKKTNKSDYIMPTRLDSIPSENIWKDSESCLRIVYNYEFMPKGLVNQISAELSRYITDDDEVWNNAVNFSDGETISQVFEDFYKRKIIVKAKGTDARGLIKIIMNAVNDITDGYKGVKSKITIPCTCDECQKNSEPTMFSYEMLLEKIKQKREIVTCNLSDQIFKIESLLFNIGLTGPTIINEKLELKTEIKIESREKIKVFVTYSWSDENGVFDVEHQKKVGKFSNQLRIKWDMDSSFDLQTEESNFTKMMYDNLHRNDKIIVVLSKGYAEKANGLKNNGVQTEYSRIINDIQDNPKKYILVSFEDRNNEIFPFGFKGSDAIVIKEDLVETYLPAEQNRLLSKLKDEPILDIPELGGKSPDVRKMIFD